MCVVCAVCCVCQPIFFRIASGQSEHNLCVFVRAKYLLSARAVSVSHFGTCIAGRPAYVQASLTSFTAHTTDGYASGSLCVQHILYYCTKTRLLSNTTSRTATAELDDDGDENKNAENRQRTAVSA